LAPKTEHPRRSREKVLQCSCEQQRTIARLSQAQRGGSTLQSRARIPRWARNRARLHASLAGARTEDRAGLLNARDLLQVGGKPYLVAPRGRTQWVRNAEATGEIALKRGRARRTYRLRPIPDAEKPAMLKLYLDNYKSAVQRYFPVPAGSPAAAFRDIASNYPVFELLPA